MKPVQLLLLFIATIFLFNFSERNAELTKEERKIAVDYMERTKEDLLKSIKDLTPEQLNFKSSPDAWSVAECVEHLAISETNLFGMFQGTLKETANPAKRSEMKHSDDAIFNMISDRTYKVKTREQFEPTGKFGTHEGAVNEFKTKRDATIQYIKSTSDDLRNHFFTFPVEAIGTLDSYQVLVFMAGHTKRHTLQIEEVKSDPAFPKKK